MTVATRTAPFLGPRPYLDRDEDRARFFARSEEADEITALVLGHQLTVVYAQSGAGKTSVFNAAVLPLLRDEGFEVFPLARVGGGLPPELDDDGSVNPYVFNTLSSLLPSATPAQLATATLPGQVRASARDDVARVLVIDQFEEIFTHVAVNPRARRNFFEQLGAAFRADPQLRVVLVLREEYIAQLEPFARLVPERMRIRFRLERLDEEAALAAVTEPLLGTGRSFAPGVAERLVAQLASAQALSASGDFIDLTGGHVEPVQLQVVCLSLWNGLPDGVDVITDEHLDEFGDVDEALGRFYESAIEAVIEAGHSERQVRDWFSTKLITASGTRGTVMRGEHDTDGLPNDALDELQRRHLVRAEFRSGARWYELTHDRLVLPIRTQNDRWREAYLADNPLAEGALTWDRRQGDPSALLRGRGLDDAEAFAARPDTTLTPLEQAYLEESRKERQRRRRLRRLFLATVAALLVAIVVALFGWWQWNEARQAREDAVAQRDRAETLQLAADERADEAERARLAAEAAEQRTQTALDEAEDARSATLAALSDTERERARAEAALTNEAAARREADDAREDTEAALDETDAARARAEAALLTAGSRLNLLTALLTTADEGTRLTGSIVPGKPSVQAFLVPPGQEHLVVEVVYVSDPIAEGVTGVPVSPLQGTPEPTFDDLGLSLERFESRSPRTYDDSCFCVAASRPADGIWTVTLQADREIFYDLRVSYGPPPRIERLVFGRPQDAILPVTGQARWIVDADQGQRVTVSSDGGASVSLLDEGGRWIAGNGTNVVRAPRTGTFIVDVFGFAPAGSSYTIVHEDIPTLQLNQVERVRVTSPQQVDTFLLVAEAGDRARILASTASGFEVPFTLTDPDGEQVPRTTGGAFVLEKSGNYLLTVTDAFVDYLLAWVSETTKSEPTPLLPGEARSASLSGPGELDRWSITIDGPSTLALAIEGGSTSDGVFLVPTARILDPQGRILATTVDTFSADRIVLPSAGTYVVEVSAGAATGPYTIRADVLAPVERGELVAGSATTASIDVTQQPDRWTVTGDPGQVLAIEVVGIDGFDPSLEVHGDEGLLVNDIGDGTRARATVTIPDRGSVQLWIFGFAGVTGTYDVEVS